ncbi:MAG: hypothetical protein ISS74_04980 [Planctomycetes bacterium]|nr:hypothetical protein [Planctomycetota bacterium]
MRRRMAHLGLVVLALAAAAAPVRAGAPPPEPVAGPPQEAEGATFLTLPVTSQEEGLGEKVEFMLRAKAKRLGAVVYDRSSVAEALAGRTVSLQTPPGDLARLARERFQASIAVVGHVAGTEPYTVTLMAVYADDAAGAGVFRRDYRAANHHLIAVEMAKAVYDILGLPQPEDPLRMLRQDPAIEARWREAPNLVRNPGFEEPAPGGRGPAHWQDIEPQMAWVANPDGPGASASGGHKNMVLKYDMDKATAASYGLDFYSDWIAIEAGATYRFACRYKTLGPTPKIFLKGYHPFPAQNGYPAQRRETYRRQVHPTGGKGQWHTVTADFVPESTTPDQTPTHLKVDLYAYWPKGVIYWDDVVLKKVRDAPSGTAGAPGAETGAGDKASGTTGTRGAADTPAKTGDADKTSAPKPGAGQPRKGEKNSIASPD